MTTLHEIDPNAWDAAKQLVIDVLDIEKARLMISDSDFEAKLSSYGEITLEAVAVEQGTWTESEGQPVSVRLDQKNIDELFERAGHRLGEGLHLDYWQAHYDEDDPNLPKLALFLTVQNEKAWNALEKSTGERIQALFKQHNHVINQLTTVEREEYHKVREIAKDPEALDFLPPTEIMVAMDDDPKSGFRNYPGHLFVDEKAIFPADLNQWEKLVIEQEMHREDFIGWLRNIERKPWALALLYEYRGEFKPMYPDFLVVRKESSHLVVDILEPHGDQHADCYAKAKGLALFANKHAPHFGRIEFIRIINGEIKRLDFANTSIRAKVLSVNSNQALDLIFGD